MPRKRRLKELLQRDEAEQRRLEALAEQRRLEALAAQRRLRRERRHGDPMSRAQKLLRRDEIQTAAAKAQAAAQGQAGGDAAAKLPQTSLRL
tara:strand:- start:14 stop:289 length:276 start_codon:yes stop_codon:yes gene_type:complete